jgi:hypothetical protein
MRISIQILYLIVCVSFSGCVIGPTVDERSPKVSGRVVDAKTQQPLSGVLISLHEHPDLNSTSDVSGHFVLRGTKNFHLFTMLGICSTSFPEGKYYGDTLDLTKNGYHSLQIDARKYLPAGITNTDGSNLTLRDVFLIPSSEH